MQAEIVKNLAGRPVKDLYGRELGSAIGFIYNINGELKSVGVDQGNGTFVQYAGHRLVPGDGELILVPDWKVDSQGLRVEKERLQGRARALKEQSDSSAVSKKMQEEMERLIRSAQESFDRLSQKAKVRLAELNEQDDVLDTFLASIRLQVASGETDEQSFESAMEYCTSSRQRNAKEREELERILEILSDGIEAE